LLYFDIGRRTVFGRHKSTASGHPAATHASLIDQPSSWRYAVPLPHSLVEVPMRRRISAFVTLFLLAAASVPAQEAKPAQQQPGPPPLKLKVGDTVPDF